MIGSGRMRWAVVGCVVVLAAATFLVVRLISGSAPDCTRTPCDGGDPRLASGTRTVNPQARVWSRTVTLIVADGGASAGIEYGQAGDSVWVERRDHPEKLGAATVPTAGSTQSTAFYRFARGQLRACGKAGDRPEIRCTRWTGSADPPPDRRLRAVERLLDRYDQRTGLWENDVSTWQSANALTALIDYMTRTGDRQYLDYVEMSYGHGDVARLGVPRVTGYNDDELWWALAWLRAFDLTSDQRYLRAAQAIVDRLDTQRAAFCDGGLVWAQVGADPELRPWAQVNTITNALYLTATAQLSTRADPAQRAGYLARATATETWFTRRAGRALLDRSGLINDHLDQYADTCVLVDEEVRWTYNQGALIAGSVALYRATGDRALLDRADTVAAAATGAGSPFLTDGVLNEFAATRCPGPQCRDAESFKGILVRGYRDLLDTGLSRVASREFLVRQADSLSDRDGEYGFRWAGPIRDDDHPNTATQTAALDALNAG